MAIQIDIPPDLTNTDRAFIFQDLNIELEAEIIYSQLNGLYTGICAITLWNIFMNKSRTTGWFMVTITILLYILTITNYGIGWYYRYSLFITHGQSFWTSYLADIDANITFILLSVTSIICTMLADIIMIWRCWLVWGR
ncbi:hypothetical protein EDD85DRAFT_859121 [Armillaria nabsnona]|nr:hypothetical protein EDD85DRAFT_859121 [Armillaria nabsnona]